MWPVIRGGYCFVCVWGGGGIKKSQSIVFFFGGRVLFKIQGLKSHCLDPIAWWVLTVDSTAILKVRTKVSLLQKLIWSKILRFIKIQGFHKLSAFNDIIICHMPASLGYLLFSNPLRIPRMVLACCPWSVYQNGKITRPLFGKFLADANLKKRNCSFFNDVNWPPPPRSSELQGFQTRKDASLTLALTLLPARKHQLCLNSWVIDFYIV